MKKITRKTHSSKIGGKKLTKMNKSRKNMKKKKGGEVLDSGSEGCILDSFNCNDSQYMNNDYVVKVFKTNKMEDEDDNEEEYHFIHEILLNNDPNEERYAIYHEKNENQCSLSIKDLQTCEKKLNSKINGNRIFLTKKLTPIKNIRELTVPQYRHLRDSVINLRNLNIFHGDLYDNVMINPTTGLPVIIDWGHGSRLLRKDDSELVKQFDYNVFLREYKSNRK